MFAFYLKNALLSMRRTPLLTGLLVIIIGIATATMAMCYFAYLEFARDPIPQKSNRLFHVVLDIRSPTSAGKDYTSLDKPVSLTYKDMMGLVKSDIPRYQSANFLSRLAVFPDRERGRPFKTPVRMCHADFFPMFNVPFKYGGPWDKKADSGPEQVVVLSEQMNRRLFDGQNSVGRKLRIEDRDFAVVGVLEPWRPKPKFYDPLSGSYLTDDNDAIFMPFHFLEKMETSNMGPGHCFSGVGLGAENYIDRIKHNECAWILYWVELDTKEQKDAYQAFLKEYSLEQHRNGRFPKPPPSGLLDLMSWHREAT
ncbi:MAG: ABC transporter permease, partial [Proteobacteria bacterium]|nr:ABC transporter permease [Pseudomonadota bacterium]